jgi:hypothetical protein
MQRFAGQRWWLVTALLTVPVLAVAADGPGATTRTPILPERRPALGPARREPDHRMLHGYLNPVAAGGAYLVTLFDPATGGVFPGAGTDVVHLDIASFFAR